MIVLDTSDKTSGPHKSCSLSSLSDVASVGSSQRPPTYRSAGSSHSLQPMFDVEPPSALDPPLKPPKKPRLEDRRWFRGLLYVLALYAVVSIAVAIPYIVSHSRDGSGSTTPYQRIKPPDSEGFSGNAGSISINPVGVPSADGMVVGCNTWDYTYEYGYPDNLNFSRLTYCIGHGTNDIWLHALNQPEQLISGQFTVMLNPDKDELDYMVDVMVTYPSDDYEAKDSTAVCLMQAGSTMGVGLYTPPNASYHDLTYQITFYMPHAARYPLNLSHFNTFLPYFKHSFQDLDNAIIFGDVGISGISSPVNGTIAGTTVNITTSQAPIIGNYHASESLVLQTSSAKIDTNITLGNIPGQDLPTKLYMNSDGGAFSATVNLTASSGNASSGNASSLSNITLTPPSRPQYSTHFIGQDSPVTLFFHHDESVNFSDLTIRINTTLNRAVIILDDKFEGQFSLQSINGTVLVSDLAGDAQLNGPAYNSVFPGGPSRRSLKFDHLSTSHARGFVKRDDVLPLPPPPSGSGKVDVQIQNQLALIALGFVSSGQTSPPGFTPFGVPGLPNVPP